MVSAPRVAAALLAGLALAATRAGAQDTVAVDPAPADPPAADPALAPAPIAVSAEEEEREAEAQAADEARCEQAPVFDPGSPRFELSAGGGYSLLVVTFRTANFTMDDPRMRPDGLYQGGLVRGEAAFALGSLSLSVLYTHIFSTHDGTGQSREWGILSGEIGLQCACQGSVYVWSFGVEGGYDILNEAVLAGIEHRSLFYLYEGLFLGFDFDVAILVGLPFGGPSGGGFETSLFLGYAFG